LAPLRRSATVMCRLRSLLTPRHGSSTRMMIMKNAVRGFTLIELLVTIVLVAVLLTLAAPNFRTLVQNNRVTTQANELVSALNLARAEAVKRGRNTVTLIEPVANGWSATVSIGDEVLREVDRGNAGIGINLVANLEVAYAPTGVPEDSPFVLNLQPVSNCSGTQRREVRVTITGQVITTRQPCL